MHGFFFGSHIRTLEQHYKQHLQDYQDSKYSDMKAHAGTVHCFHLIGVLCVADKVLLQDLPLWLDGTQGPVVDWLNGWPGGRPEAWTGHCDSVATAYSQFKLGVRGNTSGETQPAGPPASTSTVPRYNQRVTQMMQQVCVQTLF